MGAKPVEKVVGVKGGGGATEAAAENALAEEARTKLSTKRAAESLVPPKRKRVMKMVWDYMVKAVAAAASTSFRKKKISPA